MIEPGKKRGNRDGEENGEGREEEGKRPFLSTASSEKKKREGDGGGRKKSTLNEPWNKIPSCLHI